MNITIDKFLSDNYDGDINYTMIEDPDTDYYIVQIRIKGLSTEDLLM